ncbi:MAG TPA: FKBP-type peptidyl-prolyl cis-trans isomerase [Allosphingosinicella sp.]|nr:FKBP-type peptidyl-prolyl cis-trans isomerase [Allosphingosinicella sp.]
MSVTAVPIRPLKKGSVLKLWLGIIVLLALVVAAAWYTTGRLHFTKTASGLEYRVIQEGEGPHPGATDLALINYTGRLQDGTVFDSNEGGQPVPLPVNGSIAGFSEALQLMNKGATYRLRIPPNLGYGATGAGGGVIPPNATLEFDVTLVDFRALTPEQIQQMQMMQMMQQQGGAGGAGAPPGGPEGGAPGGPEGAPGGAAAGAPPGGADGARGRGRGAEGAAPPQGNSSR